ncbi:MAG TPA: hypothetical protein VI815_03095 [Candidatus Nanoarchaeia archaeon]|nr:hypothetical protein [Candidatus Nanoarchaeia archaeon]
MAEFLPLILKNGKIDNLSLGDGYVSFNSAQNWDRGIFAGGGNNVIDYVSISHKGNAADFGDVDNGGYTESLGACSSGTRGVFAGGRIPGSTYSAQMIYITIATLGNSTNFGNLTTSARRAISGTTNKTRGIFCGGDDNSSIYTYIDYITIATTGNSTSFGSLSSLGSFTGSCSNNTRGVCAGGYATGFVATNIIEYVTIATTGNSTDFGDLVRTSTYTCVAISDLIKALFCVIGYADYVTIATTSNASYFSGLIPGSVQYSSGCSNGLYGIIGGGTSDSTMIILVNINTSAMSEDFGDLSSARYFTSALSGN